MREIGTYNNSEELGGDFLRGSSRLFMESYFELTMCTMLNGIALKNAYEDGILSTYF